MNHRRIYPEVLLYFLPNLINQPNNMYAFASLCHRLYYPLELVERALKTEGIN